MCYPKFVRHPAIGTDAERVIASLPQDFREHRIAMRVRQVEFMGTVFRRKHPGEQRHLRRQAPAARRNGLFVDHTFGSQSINMRRCGAGVAIA